MIRVIGVYRWVEGASFNHDYYNSTHMQITRELLSPFGLVKLESDRFIIAASPQPGAIIAASHAYFPSLEIARHAVASTGAALMTDVAKYTNLKPELSFAIVENHG
jgi:uncharacterized protein (TIGR02118 family)